MKLYKAAGIKKWDALSIRKQKITSVDLMERAANKFVQRLLGSYHFKKVLVVCGPGNNGGDGYAIARILDSRNFEVEIFPTEAPKSNDALHNEKRVPKSVVRITDLKAITSDIIIDAIFGIGFSGEMNEHYSEVINSINSSKKRVVSVDTPSGMSVDKVVQFNKSIIKADCTITFEQPKLAFFFRENEKYIGNLKTVSIGLSENDSNESWAELIDPSIINLIPKSNFGHKGDNGRLQIIGGLDKMAGATVLAAKAAYRSGCGYVHCLCSDFSQNIVLNHLPEAIVSEEIHEKVTSISIGMGLGTSEKAQKLFIEALRLKLPTLIDADAINLISQNAELIKLIPMNSILTPHLGELQRLLHCNAADEALLLEKQIAFSKKHKVFIVQKGKYSKLTTPEGKIYINPTGNNGMAKAGSGDVLSGIIGGLLAQGYKAIDASKIGIYVHGLAADICIKNTPSRGLIPSDYVDKIPEAFITLG